MYYLIGYLDGWYDKSHRLGEEHSHDRYSEWEPQYSEGYRAGWEAATYEPDLYINEGRANWNKRITNKWR